MGWLSKDGSKRTGKTFPRGKRVGVAKVINGRLHIVAPPNVSPLKLPKQPKK